MKSKALKALEILRESVEETKEKEERSFNSSRAVKGCESES